MKLYREPGRSYLICPLLLKQDPRHGEHNAGIKYPIAAAAHHDPSQPNAGHTPGCGCLIAWERHASWLFVWPAGGRPPKPEEHRVCSCGARLVHSDLDDLYDEALLAEA